MKTGIFYGSTTGATADIARRIARALGVGESDIHDVARTAPAVLGDYGRLVLGSSTWGNGEVQDDWYDFLDGAEALDLRGKSIAIFGEGDETMTDTFCSAGGKLHDRLEKTGVKFIAPYNIVGYHFDRAGAVPADAVEAEGLLIDEVNHPELTATRLAGWATLIHEAAEK